MANRRRGLKPKVKWPPHGKPVDQWADAELTAVAINPIVTGLGRHPRTVTDEDWVVSCERIMREAGAAQFLTDLLQVLRITAPVFVGQPAGVGDYPQGREAARVPLPNVAHPGDRGADEQWTEAMVAGILCNPVYAGIGPFPAVVSESQWRTAALNQLREIGPKQFLIDMLYVLKRSFGAPGQGAAVPPYGYGIPEPED